MSVRFFAPAKINLSLRVGAPLPNGRHPLDSLVAFTLRVGDHIILQASDDLKLASEGPFGADVGADADNLVMRAAQGLQALGTRRLGANITLVKNLPLASGIGGGSADAAATLIGLNEIWNLGLSVAHLQALGGKLGADVPACILGTPLRMTGTGEDTAAVSGMAEMGIVLVNPLISCPTSPVYHSFDQMGAGRALSVMTLPDVSTQDALLEFLRATPNDLEPAAIALVPEIAPMLNAIASSPNVLLARMSGSGATCFGLYASLADAHIGALAIKQALAFAPIWVEADMIN